MNLRLIVDSQRQVSSQLAPFAERIDPQVAERWTGRAATHALIQKQLRNIGGRLGNGGSAVTEAANAAARLRALPADTIVEPHVLAGFQTLFDRVDHRIADIVEDGIDRGAFVERIKVPQVGANAKSLIYAVEEKSVPVSRPSDLELVRTLREQLRPPPVSATPASPGRSRAELHTGLLHRPGTSEVVPDAPRL